MDRSTRLLILLAAAALVVIAVALIKRNGSQPSQARPALNTEEKAYLPQIVVTEARMSAAQNFLGGRVIYLDAQVTNKGTRLVRQLKLQLEFRDTLEQVILRETVRPVTLRTPPLKPGETRSFQVAFDHMPDGWNQATPTITPKYVSF